MAEIITLDRYALPAALKAWRVAGTPRCVVGRYLIWRYPAGEYCLAPHNQHWIAVYPTWERFVAEVVSRCQTEEERHVA